MPIKPGTHKPIKLNAPRHTVIAADQSAVRRDFTNASGYGYKWRKESKAWLQQNPLCAECERSGRITLATDVDHIIPHRGDMDLFWRRSNWQSLCSLCHKIKTGKGL